MVLADTSRSRAYLQALVRNKLFPSYVIILPSQENKINPGEYDRNIHINKKLIQEQNECWSEVVFDPALPIECTMDTVGIEYIYADTGNINDESVICLISARAELVFIYSGFGGVLLSKTLLSAGKKFLHVHGGYLPNFKGSTTNYFSLIAENNVGASSLFLSDTIDSGPLLMRKAFPAPINRQEIDHIYDSAARAKVLVETLQSYVHNQEWVVNLTATCDGETYYIIHPVLKHIAILAGKNEQ